MDKGGENLTLRCLEHTNIRFIASQLPSLPLSEPLSTFSPSDVPGLDLAPGRARKRSFKDCASPSTLLPTNTPGDARESGETGENSDNGESGKEDEVRMESGLELEEPTGRDWGEGSWN